MDQSIINISTFGSIVRQDIDDLSDIDVLALVKDGKGTVPEAKILEYFSQANKQKVSISWYGQAKMKEMFSSGHLFAWHLYEESKPVENFEHISQIMGKPKEYLTTQEDISGLIELLNTTMAAFQNNSPNLTYELGLAYLAARNIAMSASWHLTKDTHFGRYSPYKLETINFPISLNDYEILMKCRMASQRGLSFNSTITHVRAIEICDMILSWARETEKAINDVS